MNANQLINMVVRMVMRQFVSRGINAGMNAAGNQFNKRKHPPSKTQDVAERPQHDPNRQG